MGELDFSSYLCVCAAPVEQAGFDRAPVAVVGVGKAAAALGVVQAVRERVTARPCAGVLLFGVAGAFRGGPVAPGELCVVTEDRFGDEGVQTPVGFVDVAELGLGETGPFGSAGKPTLVAAEMLDAPRVKAVTVSSCSGTDASAAAMQARTAADIETMEGAAVALACRQLGLPLVHVRAISNWTGDRERGEWDLPAAVGCVQGALHQLLDG